MARTSISELPPTGWIADETFRAQLRELGCIASDDQLERWRGSRFGLLPSPVQIPTYGERGQVNGSAVWHAPGEARQVLAVERVLSQLHRVEKAGPILWAAGFDVGEQHYLPALAQANRLWRNASRFAAGMLRRFSRRDDIPTIGDAIAGLDGLSGAIAKIARRSGHDEFAQAANIAAEIAAGEFEGFDATEADRNLGRGSPEVVEKALDFDAARLHAISGQKFTPHLALNGVLQLISEAQGAELSLGDFSKPEIDCARNDVRNALKIAICLYETLAWIYGRNAFGLRLAAYLARQASARLIFAYTLGIARMRRLQTDLYPTAQIERMASQAEAGWLISNCFRRMSSVRPDLANLIGSQRFKVAFSNEIKRRNLLEDLQRNSFPAVEIEPWNSWRSLAKRTMPTGLLVMSIGSPAHVSVQDIVRSASGDATR